jgi:hypothetical protein
MHLTLSHLRFPLPVAAYDTRHHSEGEAIWIRVPTADPKELSLTPGMEGDLEFDDGRKMRIKIGETWSAPADGAELRIPVQELLPVVSNAASV